MISLDDFRNSLGFVIISCEPNIFRLKDTVRSIRNNFSDTASILCSTPKSCGKNQIEEMSEVCPSFRGGETIMSLINNGVRKMGGKGWRVLVMEGARLPRGMEGRYHRWIEDDRDVLYPIVFSHDREGRPCSVLTDFGESTLNGLMFHTSLFKETGAFSDNPIIISKNFWGMDAKEKGARFKAILGVKII
jgi:hypothetical protein